MHPTLAQLLTGAVEVVGQAARHRSSQRSANEKDSAHPRLPCDRAGGFGFARGCRDWATGTGGNGLNPTGVDLDASSGPSGEDPTGTVKFHFGGGNGATRHGDVSCLSVSGNTAIIGFGEGYFACSFPWRPIGSRAWSGWWTTAPPVTRSSTSSCRPARQSRIFRHQPVIRCPARPTALLSHRTVSLRHHPWELPGRRRTASRSREGLVRVRRLGDLTQFKDRECIEFVQHGPDP